MEARSLGSMAFEAARMGRVVDAVPLLTEAFRIDRELDNRLEIAVDVGRFAKILATAGRPETAVRLLSCSKALCDELNAAVPWVTRMYEETLTGIRRQLDEDAFAEAWEEGLRLTADEAVALAVDSLGD
jgi:adenine-specific DNA methylase